MKLGILGGTFDPVHEGHLALARAAQRQLGLDKVIFIPAFISPHKISRKDAAPALDRFRMVELAVKNCPGFEVSSIELDRSEISYTVETLRALKKEHPEDQLFLILGSDTAGNLSSWKEPGEIRKLAVVAAAPRPGYLDIGLMPGVQAIQMDPCPISASDIRRRLLRGEKNPDGILPKEVEKYIGRMNLYRNRSHDTAS